MFEASRIPLIPARWEGRRFIDGGHPLDVTLLIDRIRRGFALRRASLAIREGDGLRIRTCAASGLPRLERATPLCERTLAEGQVVVVPDIGRDSSVAAPAEEGPPVRFYAGIPLFLDPDRPVGILSLFDTRPRRLSARQVRRLSDEAADVVAMLARERDQALVARLTGEVEAQASLIREQAAALAHSGKIFQRASEAARIGVWECELPGEILHWTDMVYDIFDLPRGAPLDRHEILSCYTEESLRTLQAVRSKAIEERGSFQLDAEIVTARGCHRWVRITATVESENGVPVRIFGMKQDITEEKLLWERTRYLAEFDVMTDLANRSQFQSRLADLCEGPSGRGALLLLDLDGFKQINDTFGHSLGDECLKEAARRLRAACPEAAFVARIGGDEFAVLLGPGPAFDRVEELALTIVDALEKPFGCGGSALSLGASLGIARLAGGTPSDLFTRADAALYAAKAAGRNTFRIFTESMRANSPFSGSSGRTTEPAAAGSGPDQR